MPALTLKFALVAIAAVVILSGMWWSAKRPNRSRRFPGRFRMPIYVAIIGWLLTAVGFVLGLASFTLRVDENIWPTRIVTAIIFGTGLLFVMMYRNRFVEERPDSVRLRSIFGRERVIAYADIAEARMLTDGRRPMLTARTRAGKRVVIDPRLYPVQGLIAAARRSARG